MSKKAKKVWRRAIAVSAGLAIAAGAVLLAPCPIEGNWEGGLPRFLPVSVNRLSYRDVAIAVLDPANCFRFEGGRIFYVSRWKGASWVGDYKKTGCGKYAASLFYPAGPSNVTIRSGMWKMKVCGTGLTRRRLFEKEYGELFRSCERMEKAGAFDVLAVPGNGGTASYYLEGEPKTLREMGELFKEIREGRAECGRPLEVYVRGDAVPRPVLKMLSESGTAFHAHTRQEWVLDPRGNVVCFLQAGEGNGPGKKYWVEGRFVEEGRLGDLPWKSPALRNRVKKPRKLHVVLSRPDAPKPLIEELDAAGAEYTVSVNREWVENTRPDGRALIVYGDGKDVEFLFRGEWLNLPVRMEHRLGQLASRKQYLEQELIFFVPDGKPPEELKKFLKTCPIPYRIQDSALFPAPAGASVKSRT